MATNRRRHTLGAFDIRNVIGALLGFYGIVLLVLGVTSDAAPDQTGDLDANLWAGVVLLVVGVGFFVWSRLRPVVVEHVETEDPSAPTRPTAE